MLFRFRLLNALLLFFPSAALSQGYSADEAPGHMTAPPGFSVKLVESEPVITQPVAMEFDDRGRLWVVQYLQYPNPEGLKRVAVDRYSRTTYDRIPDPPPHGPKGADCITILEDTNGDGRMDAHKNFVEQLNLCSGLAFGHSGVFVLQVPYLLFYPDMNHDDVPDGDPEVLLTGFGMEDAHSVANSLTWGPDGWLYGNQGSTVTAHIRGIEFQQGVWRYHPRTKAFELFAEGGGNMWGLDFDASGELYSSTNLGPYLMIHAVQGAYYWKAFGKHGVLHNPYAYGYFEHVEHYGAEGGHVTVGGQVYQADAYPAEFRGKYIGANLLSHDVYYHEIMPKGSTVETKKIDRLLDSHDTWFAPSDMTTGPNGALYIADWNDRRTAHPDPDAEWDRSNGRIYEIAYEGMKPLAPFNLLERSSGELVDLLTHPNAWFRRRARTLLAERQDASVLPRLREQALATDNPNLALESLWALHASGGFREKLALKLLRHPSADLRKWTVRFLGDAESVSPKVVKSLAALAEKEDDVHVRSQLAATAKRLPAQDAFAVAGRLIARDGDAEDLHIPLLLWWAVEAHALENADDTLEQLQRPAIWAARIGSATVLPRLIRRFAADGSAAGDRAATQMLEGAPGAKERDVLLASLEQGLQDRGQAQQTAALGNLFETFAVEQQPTKTAVEEEPVSEELVNTLNRLYAENPGNVVLLRLATRLGNDAAYEHTRALAADASLGTADRIAVLKILGRYGRADAVDLLFDLLQDQDDQVRVGALDALRHYSEDTVATRLMTVYAAVDAGQKTAVRDVLFSKPAWTRVFLDAVDKGAVPPDEVPLTELRTIAHHGDEVLNALVEKHWGTVRAGTPEEKLAEMRRMNNELNAAPGDPAAGKKVYEENCMKCHTLFGEGGKVGPDLTQSNRMDREYLLVSLVDPSFLVRKEYQQFVIETKDGELLNGVTGPSMPGTVTIFNANAEPTTLSNDQIDTMRETELSLMPEGLLTALPGQAIRDLFAYLQKDLPAQKF